MAQATWQFLVAQKNGIFHWFRLCWKMVLTTRQNSEDTCLPLAHRVCCTKQTRVYLTSLVAMVKKPFSWRLNRTSTAAMKNYLLQQANLRLARTQLITREPSESRWTRNYWSNCSCRITLMPRCKIKLQTASHALSKLILPATMSLRPQHWLIQILTMLKQGFVNHLLTPVAQKKFVSSVTLELNITPLIGQRCQQES